MFRSSLGAFVAVTLISAGCSSDPQRTKADAVARGNRYLDSQRFNEAIIEYRRAIQIDSQYGEARAKLGEAYLRSGDVPNALRETVRAADLLPAQTDVQIKAGNLLLATGRFDDARGRADHVLKRSPENVEALVLRGNALASLRDLDGALTEFEKAAATDPQRAVIQANIGAIQMAKGSPTNAEAAFRKATELAPTSALARVSYANFLLATNQSNAAEAELKTAVRLSPRDPMGHRAIAMLYIRTNRAAAAEPHLRALADISDDPRARFALARFYFATDRTDAALRELNTLAARKDSYADATLEIAAAQYRAGQTVEGHRLLDEVRNRVPDHAGARLLESEFLVEERKWPEAIAAAKSALERDPRLAAAHFVIGLAHQGQREFDEAKQAFNEVLRLQPNATRAQLALAELHLLNRDGATAQQFAALAAARSPRSAEAQATLIKALLANRNLAAAEEAIKSFKTKFPDDEQGYVLEGTLQFMRKDFGNAEKAYARAVELDPGSVPAASGHVQLLLATGRGAEAKTYVNQLTNSHAQKPDFLILAARTNATMRDYSAAETQLQQALQQDPSRKETYSMLAQLYVLEKKPEQALAQYRKLAGAAPKSVSAGTMIGTMLQVTDRRKEAKEAYRKVLAVDPSAPVAANNLAWMLAQDNEDLDVALQLAQTAKAGLPETSSAADTLGWIYFKKGLTSQAIAQFTEARDKEPANAGFHYRLGFAYAQSGELGLARRTLERALTLNAEAPEADEARATLARLSKIGS